MNNDIVNYLKEEREFDKHKFIQIVGNHRLARYSSYDINEIDLNAALSKLDSVYHLSKEEIKSWTGVGIYLDGIRKLPREDRERLVKKNKQELSEDFSEFLKRGEQGHYASCFSSVFKLISESNRKARVKTDMAMTLKRTMDFFYLSDLEMSKLAESFQSLIENAECKLFSAEGPYGDYKTSDDFVTDIINREGSIRKYCDETSREKIPHKFIPVRKIIGALNIIRKWNEDWTTAPEEYKGFFWINERIRNKVSKLYEDEDSWIHCLSKDKITAEMIHLKSSGYALNKEANFRDWTARNHFASWKNIEGSAFIFPVKNKRLALPFTRDLIYVDHLRDGFFCDVVYYSLGKGPAMKGRFVGQGVASLLLAAWPLAELIKDRILGCSKLYRDYIENPSDGNGIKRHGVLMPVPNPECVNIYDNETEIEHMVGVCYDLICTDYEAYSDYLNRSSFKFVMSELWGLPYNYVEYIYNLMSMPVRVAIQDSQSKTEIMKDYDIPIASVMGLPVNFLLITFVNAIIWIISGIITGSYDLGKFMGDDVIRGRMDRKYTDDEIGTIYGVSSYFNLKLQHSKTEHLLDTGIVSFCKRSYNIDREQVSGFSGETIWKQVPFLSGVNSWINDIINHGYGEDLTEDDIDQYITDIFEVLNIASLKFHYSKDPYERLEDYIKTLKKIPVAYGGFSLAEVTGEVDKIWLTALLNQIWGLIAEDLSSLQHRPEVLRKIHYLAANLGEDHPIVKGVRSSMSLSDKIEDLKKMAESISKVISSQNIISHEDLKVARQAAQKIQQIVLERDARLVNSSSTKNRIDFKIDQDKLIKGRLGYLSSNEEVERSMIIKGILNPDSLKQNPELCLQVRRENQDKASCGWIMSQLIENKGTREGIQKYLEVLEWREKHPGNIIWYLGGPLGMVAGFYSENLGGIVRIHTDRDQEYSGKGKFVVRSELSKESQKEFDEIRTYFRHQLIGKGTSISDCLNESLNNTLSNLQSALRDLINEIIPEIKAVQE